MEQDSYHLGIRKILQRQLDAGSIAHAYLFSGPHGVGKSSLARWFARKILGTQALERSQNIYFHDFKQSGSIEDARAIISKISIAPVNGNHSIALLLNIDSASPSAIAALLKTIEEPPQSAVILLTAQNSNLNEALRSRCLILQCNPLPFSALKDLPQFSDIDKELLVLSGGCPELVDDWHFQPAEFKKLQSNVNLLENGYGDIALAYRAVSELGELDGIDLRGIFSAWINKNKINQNPNYKKIRAGYNAYLNSYGSINKKMIIQQALLGGVDV